MKLPVGKITGQEINTVFEDSIKYHLDTYYKTLAEYEPLNLYSNWRSIVRTIDEFINIPLELDDVKDINLYLSLSLNLYNSQNAALFKEVSDLLENKFEQNVAIRFQQMTIMCHAIESSFKMHDIKYFNLSGISDATSFLQARRAYFVTTLNLIPKIAQGNKRIPEYIDTLNFLFYTMDSCLIAITNAYFNLLLNYCLPDFEIESNGTIAKGNFNFKHLEGFFLEPERLSFIDQIELRPETVNVKEFLQKESNKIFSFVEILNTIVLFESAFEKYEIENKQEFIELNSLLDDIKDFVKDDYHIVIKESEFTKITKKYNSLILYCTSNDYFDNLNNYSPFQKINDTYFSTVVLMTRFVHRSLSHSLLNNRTFQINSGFIFEDKVTILLKQKGFSPTGITRINRKEFDVITIKDDKVFNFQCKNNLIDTSRIHFDYKKIGRYNKSLIRYYEKALIKEANRESLIIKETGIDKIEHFVISRFPVITRNKRILNFTDLEEWIPD